HGLLARRGPQLLRVLAEARGRGAPPQPPLVAAKEANELREAVGPAQQGARRSAPLARDALARLAETGAHAPVVLGGPSTLDVALHHRVVEGGVLVARNAELGRERAPARPDALRRQEDARVLVLVRRERPLLREPVSQHDAQEAVRGDRLGEQLGDLVGARAP